MKNLIALGMMGVARHTNECSPSYKRVQLGFSFIPQKNEKK